MSNKYTEFQNRVNKVLLDKVYARIDKELKQGKFSFREPYAYFGINDNNYNSVYDLLSKDVFSVSNCAECDCEEDGEADRCTCKPNSLLIEFFPKSINQAETKTDNVSNASAPVRRNSQDYSRDTTFNWRANGPKISKVGCPCNNDMANFGGYQHCERCGSNGGYYSDHD
jgi:hypothetical protein